MTANPADAREWLAQYPPGVPHHIEIPDRILDENLLASAREYPRRIALDFLGSTTTFSSLAAQVAQAARVLHEAGVRAGDRVALVMPNCPQHVVAFYATLRLGAVVAEHNPLATADEIAGQLSRHRARVVVAWQKALPTVLSDGRERTVFAVDLVRALPGRTRLLLRLPVAAARRQREAMQGPVPNGVRVWEDEVKAAEPWTESSPGQLSDIAVLLHTGGTTGVPKAVPLTHRNLQANVEQGRRWVPGLRDGEETFAGILPFFHAFGLTLGLTIAVAIGSTLVVLPRFDAGLTLAAQKRRPMTFVPGVPTMFDRLAAAAEAKKADMSSVNYALSGAMPLAPAIADRWERLTGGLVIEGYGMTESSPLSVGNPFSEKRRRGVIGVPMSSTEVRVVDPDNPDQDVAPGARGELLVRGAQVFSGYWEDAEETARVLLPGGWLRTGDIVTMDADGFITVVDRIKEMVISGGFNVYPSAVEDVLRLMPGVEDVAVVGVPHGDLGEQVVAAIVAHPDHAVDLDSVRAWAQDRISGYAVPKRISLVAELPRTQIGKVLRRVVRQDIIDRESQASS